MRRIIIDTREQRPYDFPGEETIRQALPSGDYSIENYEDRIAIERKSLDDWIGTILNSRERFRREIDRLRAYDYAAVIIEATSADIIAHNYKSRIDPKSLLGITTELMVRFSPIHVVLAGDRPCAKLITEKLLRFAERILDEHVSNSIYMLN